ncbi:hypothetical protein GCM10010521_74500 [Streptomyces rameus]|uniref:Uncharacterized protein n=1 Tax=Streptomyces rameus TaxID=68261 RepID=A0ABP6HU12_9ACTN
MHMQFLGEVFTLILHWLVSGRQADLVEVTARRVPCALLATKRYGVPQECLGLGETYALAVLAAREVGAGRAGHGNSGG